MWSYGSISTLINVLNRFEVFIDAIRNDFREGVEEVALAILGKIVHHVSFSTHQHKNIVVNQNVRVFLKGFFKVVVNVVLHERAEAIIGGVFFFEVAVEAVFALLIGKEPIFESVKVKVERQTNVVIAIVVVARAGEVLKLYFVADFLISSEKLGESISNGYTNIVFVRLPIDFAFGFFILSAEVVVLHFAVRVKDSFIETWKDFAVVGLVGISLFHCAFSEIGRRGGLCFSIALDTPL